LTSYTGTAGMTGGGTSGATRNEGLKSADGPRRPSNVGIPGQPDMRNLMPRKASGQNLKHLSVAPTKLNTNSGTTGVAGGGTVVGGSTGSGALGTSGGGTTEVFNAPINAAIHRKASAPSMTTPGVTNSANKRRGSNGAWVIEESGLSSTT
jgi:hypothetical protein